MKRIVLCFDGTWNKAEKEAATNIWRLAVRLKRTEEQLVWYDEGVGTSRWEKLRGAFGFGLSRNIQQGYMYLALTYEPGDRIFLFGFSRGAYTARSLVGLIRKCGILRRNDVPPLALHGLSDAQIQEQLDEAIRKTPAIAEAYDLYRQRDAGPDTEHSRRFRATHSYPVYDPSNPAANPPLATRIRLIGVWDTVGNLGVPLKTLQWVSVFNKNRYLFHDTKLSGMVEYARHALAIDEYRADYTPAIWTPDDQWTNDRLRQRWFIGAHGDVGGGYHPQQPLADIALKWMIEDARAIGLEVEEFPLPAANYTAEVTRTYEKFLLGLYQWFSRPVRRPILTRTRGEIALQYRNQDTDPTVAKRLSDDASYHPHHQGLRKLAGLE
ncbi:DUF2235 domain-containing protein [Candidatus Nitrospira bockiana]